MNALSERGFDLLRGLVHERTGITVRAHKRALVESRLSKRVATLGLASFGEYYRVLLRDGACGEEMAHLINVVTTNSTHFLREPHHLEHLATGWIPAVLARQGAARTEPLRIWSAGCSSGEEPYSIAMALRDALPPGHGLNLRILASDIDTEVLATAQAGIYPAEAIARQPRAFQARHFLRGRGRQEGLVRVKPDLAALVTFRRINLLEEPWPIRVRFDVIFCRNVLIYFDRPTQTALLHRLAAFLKPDGLLILGYSESVHDPSLGLAHLHRTVFRLAPERR